MFVFLKSDLETLTVKRDSLIESLRAAGHDMHITTNQGSETWHDNAPFDTAKGEFQRLQGYYFELDNIIRGATIFDPNVHSSEDVVGLGSEVWFTDQDGKEMNIRIGSYVPDKNTGAISYDAPVAKIILGSKKGNKVAGTLFGRSVVYSVTNVKRWI